MKIYTPIGSKDRLFEMFENVNKIKLNEDMNGIVEQNTVLEMSFDKLNSGNLNVKNKNTQTNGNETFVELACTDERNNNIKFTFKLTAREGDQEGVFGVDSVMMTNFSYQDVSGGGSVEVDENGLKQFNMEHSEDLFGIVSDYADFDTQEPEIDETYMDAIKKIDSYPFGGTPRTMQTGKAYVDEKPTNSKLRVKAPELEKIVDEEFIGATTNTSSSAQTSDKKRSVILVAHDNLTRKRGRKEYAPSTSEINAEIRRMRSNGSNIGEQTNVTQVPTPVTTDYNVGNAGDMSQMAYDNLPQQNKTEIIEQAIDYVEEILRKKGLSRNELSNDEYVFYIKKVALIMHEKDSMRMNEAKEKDGDDYPDPIGKKFKAKSTYPKPRKKPQTTVKLDEIIGDEFSDLGIPRNVDAAKQAKSDVSKHYLQRGDNYNVSPDKWTKSALPYDTQFPNPDDPTNIEYSDLREEDTESDEIEQLGREKEETGEVLKGGKGDEKSPKEFDPDQVLMGLKVEMEHSEDPMIALEIVMDHLTEDPVYYTTKDDPESSAQANASADVECNDKPHASGAYVQDGMAGEKDRNGHSIPAICPDFRNMFGNKDDEEMTDRLLGYEPKNVGDEV